ncbi:hypothetical protein PG995_005928 [Apiospora arundinis]
MKLRGGKREENQERGIEAYLNEALAALEVVRLSAANGLCVFMTSLSLLALHAQVRLATLVLAVMGAELALGVLGSALALVLLLDALDQAVVGAVLGGAGRKRLEIVFVQVNVLYLDLFSVSGEEVADVKADHFVVADGEVVGVKGVGLGEGKGSGRAEEDDGGGERELHCSCESSTDLAGG